MVKIKARDRTAVIQAPLTHENLKKLRATPNIKGWEGYNLVFEPTGPALDYVRSVFPDASWDERSQHYCKVADDLRARAVPSPAPTSQDYVYKTKPFDHQDVVFKRSRDERAFALLMQQGTGKTKVIIDNTAYLYANGKISGLLIIAKNGVHRNWIDNEIPAHLPDWCKSRIFCWRQGKEKKLREFYAGFKSDNPQLAILAVNIEALSTPKGYKLCEEFLLAFPCLMVVDESTKIKTPGAKRTKNILKLGGLSIYRRILTGTPVTKSPLDIYSQFAFLDEDILGHGSFYSFKARYAVQQDLPGKLYHGRPIKIVVGYQNLDELQSKIYKHAYRVLKSQCLDLPDKLYARRYVQLSDEQWHHYRQMEEEIATEFQGRRIVAPLAMTRGMRLHQIACGFLPSEDPKDPGTLIGAKNPRLEELMEYLEELDGKAIIGAVYRFSLREIWNAVREAYGAESCVAYAGNVKDDAKADALKQFQNNDKVRWIIAQEEAIAYGHNLTAASNCLIYANSHNLETRLQFEDRPHRIGQTKHVLYTDFEAEGTVDTDIIDNLIFKVKLANKVTGDPDTNWLHTSQTDIDNKLIEVFKKGKAIH